MVNNAGTHLGQHHVRGIALCENVVRHSLGVPVLAGAQRVDDALRLRGGQALRTTTTGRR